MKAVILASGEGVKMRPLTLTTPKPLIEIQGKRLIDYVFDAFPEEIDEVIVSVKYLAEKIKSHLGGSYKGRKIYYVEGSEKGNVIGLLGARRLLKKGERFFIFHGDEPQRREEIKECLTHKFAWVCSWVADPRSSGVATLDDKWRILEVVEKPEHPKSNWSTMGTILVDTDIFSYEPIMHSSGEYHLSLVLNQFVKDHPVYAVFGKPRPPLRSIDDINWDMKEFKP